MKAVLCAKRKGSIRVPEATLTNGAVELFDTTPKPRRPPREDFQPSREGAKYRRPRGVK
jgi:hypothetical protein